MWQGELNDCLPGNLDIIILLSSDGSTVQNSTGFTEFLPGAAVKTRHRSVCISQKMRTAKFRAERTKKMHVLQMLLISLEEIYDCYVTQEC